MLRAVTLEKFSFSWFCGIVSPVSGIFCRLIFLLVILLCTFVMVASVVLLVAAGCQVPPRPWLALKAVTEVGPQRAVLVTRPRGRWSGQVDTPAVHGVQGAGPSGRGPQVAAQVPCGLGPLAASGRLDMAPTEFMQLCWGAFSPNEFCGKASI